MTTSDFIQNKRTLRKERRIRKKKKKGIYCICKCFKYIDNWIGLILSKKYMILMLKTIWNRNIMYYEQGLSQILSQGEYSLLFAISTQIFDLSFTNNYGSQSNDDGWCFINGLNAKQKILLNLLIPAIIIITIFTLYLISKCKKSGKITFCCSTRQINFKRAFIFVCLLMVGNILTVLFKLLHCQTIGDKTYHFYFAFEECYGFTWIISMISLIVIIFIFSMIFIKLKKMTVIERQKRDYILSAFVTKYKPNYYYWEYIIFIRRICIAMFSVSVTDGNNYERIFILIMFLFLFAQYRCEPFIIDAGNVMEFILLSCFIFVIFLNLGV